MTGWDDKKAQGTASRYVKLLTASFERRQLKDPPALRLVGLLLSAKVASYGSYAYFI